MLYWDWFWKFWGPHFQQFRKLQLQFFFSTRESWEMVPGTKKLYCLGYCFLALWDHPQIPKIKMGKLNLSLFWAFALALGKDKIALGKDKNKKKRPLHGILNALILMKYLSIMTYSLFPSPSHQVNCSTHRRDKTQFVFPHWKPLDYSCLIRYWDWGHMTSTWKIVRCPCGS